MTILSTGNLIFERYRVQEKIGEGGMQEVYRARDEIFERDIALKTPKSSGGVRRFRRSARLSARVTHPNIARTLDYVEEGERFFLIEELVVGMDLDAYMRSDLGKFDPHTAAHIAHHVTKGVAASHKVEVCHRDLKPKNIMVSGDLELIKVTDFGIAKMAEAEIEDEMANANDDTIPITSQTLLGALPYISPEVIDGDATADMKSDIWSLGAILYHLTFDELPFGAGLRSMRRITSGDPPERPAFSNNQQFQPLVDQMWRIITSCLQNDPGRRPTAEELVQRFGELCYTFSRRHIGTVHSFRAGSGNHGRIYSEELSETIFFHASSVWSSQKMEDGKRVIFSPYPGEPFKRADPVIILDDEPES